MTLHGNSFIPCPDNNNRKVRLESQKSPLVTPTVTAQLLVGRLSFRFLLMTQLLPLPPLSDTLKFNAHTGMWATKQNMNSPLTRKIHAGLQLDTHPWAYMHSHRAVYKRPGVTRWNEQRPRFILSFKLFLSSPLPLSWFPLSQNVVSVSFQPEPTLTSSFNQSNDDLTLD